VYSGYLSTNWASANMQHKAGFLAFDKEMRFHNMYKQELKCISTMINTVKYADTKYCEVLSFD
jgi:hypothetical protein